MNAPANEDREDRIEVLLQLLGLERARNTIIGDQYQRGVSGGEKRRVTVGVEWAKGARVVLLGSMNNFALSNMFIDCVF